MNSKYSFNEHRHNFAMWTAVRAVQRNFASTKVIIPAIEKSGLREFVESYEIISKENFKTFHVNCANKITNALMEQKCSYGRAAKIISVYLKTSLVIPNKGINCEYIHPPFDRVLICNLIKLNKLNDYKYKPWTKLDGTKYWDLITKIENNFGNVDWTLEKYWCLKCNRN